MEHKREQTQKPKNNKRSNQERGPSDQQVVFAALSPLCSMQNSRKHTFTAGVNPPRRDMPPRAVLASPTLTSAMGVEGEN
jgi:hypothetical protein